MSLAAVKVQPSEWDLIYDHVLDFMPKYKNMHLREVKTVNKKRTLRYLHAMKADPEKPEIEGKISGPNIYCHYKLIKNKNGVIQINVIDEQGSSKELSRLESRFVIEVLNRVDDEKNNPNPGYGPKRTPGEFYLKRSDPGMNINHTNCQSALNASILEQAFLQSLEPWKFYLLNP